MPKELLFSITKKDLRIDSNKWKCKTKEYYTWWNMIARCKYKCTDSYETYGGAGIFVCKKWENSFDTFLLDMGYSPTKHHSLDRIDSNKGYNKENCRWATYSQQAMNRGLLKNSRIKYKGVSYEKKKKLYRTRITINGKTISLGRRKNAKDAAKLYDEAALKYFKEFAVTNKSLGLLNKVKNDDIKVEVFKNGRYEEE